MANNTNSTGNSGLSANLLPNIYQTPSNKKFLQATIDQLFQPGKVTKTSGYIGRENAKAATVDDLFVPAADASRKNYQLEPGMSIKDGHGNVTFFKDYIDYINQINVFGGNTANHSRLNAQEFYSWDPHIDWDKFVNFQNYYWVPYGPGVITITGQSLTVTSTFTVNLQIVGNTHEYLFTPNGKTLNPVVKLYRGQTYTFEIVSPGHPFSIKTERSTGSIDYYDNVTAQAVEKGSITFTVADNAPNRLFYQSEADINVGGVFEIHDINENTFLDVEHDLLGKKQYVLGNTPLSNGMLVEFVGNIMPATYSIGQYYVDGVGTAIKLIPANQLEVVSPYTVSEDIAFDALAFDNGPFDGATGYASQVDYITINRASQDRNPWSRYNRWFHKDVIIATSEYNGSVPFLDQNTRAIRPIIEFQADLKLFNMGTFANQDIDLVDDFTTDIFSTIEGSLGYNVDGVNLATGYKILATADTDPLVKNKIYQVEFIKIQGRNQIHLVEIGTPAMHEVVMVKRGVKNQSLVYWYDGTAWKKGQQKLNTNQAPLFDVVDENGVSYGDISVYGGSTFSGTSVFTYKVGTGTPDIALGFPLTYQNVANIGDIVFNFTLGTDSFQYKDSESLITRNIDVGYLVGQDYSGNTVYQNGWQTCDADTIQAAVRIYNNAQTNNFDIDIFDDINDLDDLVVRVYINGIRLEREKYVSIDGVKTLVTTWNVTTGPVYKTVVIDELYTAVATTDIVTIKAFATQPINSNGYYEVPVNLQNNPLNATMGNFSLGEVVDHVNSILDNTPEFKGTFPGSGNIRDLGNITSRGTKFVQHSGPLSLGIYHITSQSNNIVTAIERSRDDYNNFKRTFLALAENLGVDAAPDVMVELIMQKLNANKPKSAPYYFSDMLPYGGKITTNLTVVDARIKTYPLSEVFTLSALSSKAVGVYLNGEQLVYGRDYTFDTQGLITVTAAIAANDIITTYEYASTDGSFVPATPTKLGLWPKFVPHMYLDTTLVTPRMMIQGHDGSQILAYGDYRDDIILELEKRIFNNIKVEYNPTIFDISEVVPGYNRPSSYSLDEFNQVLSPSFYKWTSLVGADFTKPLSYDRANSFTFNYSSNNTLDGAKSPGYWRGVYRWLLDTDRPNICPWEMLGFSIEPAWWTEVYGAAPYTSDNLLMWGDLAAGIIREPGMPAVVNTKYVRPILLTHLPVDADGALVSPLSSGMISGSANQSVNNNFVFGDVSPVENAWRRSSHYPFSVLITSMLLTPAKTFGLALDRSRIVRNLAGQLVYADTNLRIKPSDIVLPSIQTSNVRVQTAGIINYVVDYILNYIFSNNTNAYNGYRDNLKNLTPQLSYRLGAFTNKAQFNLMLESKTPESTGNVFVPAEDYTVFLNKSSPLQKLTYSGVIITKLSSGYEIKGYSNSQPYFKYYNYLQSGTVINVGGISASFTKWTAGKLYTVGSIVQYGSGYFSVKTTHTTTGSFEEKYYAGLPTLPVVGGATVKLHNAWDKTEEQTLLYGATLSTVQEVVDFIMGYSAWLSDAGFVFDEFNAALNSVNNWETSAKEFMFWSTQNWSTGEDKWEDWAPNQAVPYGSIVRYNGDYFSAIYNNPPSDVFDELLYNKLDGLSNIGSSVISLSPAANSITFDTTITVVDNITDPFNTYEIFKVDGTPIPPASLNSYRSGNRVTYTTKAGEGIYGASFYLLQNEHVVIINNSTIFNDTIYSPASGYRQERLKLSGYVTTNWYGGLDIPGFVFDQATIDSWQPWRDYTTGDIVSQQGFYYSANMFIPGVAAFDATMWTILNNKPVAEVMPNWTNLASQFTDFYSLESDSFDVGQQSMAQHLIGYQKRKYLQNIIQDDVSEFKFFQGMIREKGTQNVLSKMFDALGADGSDNLSFYEEWALRVGQYGATDSFENIEFVLDEGKFRNNPQGYTLKSTVDESLSTFIIQQTPNDVYLKPAGYNSEPFPALSAYTPYLRSSGFVRPSDIQLSLGYLPEILTADTSALVVGSYIWLAFDDSLDPITGIVKGWDVRRVTESELTISDVSIAGTLLSITTDQDPADMIAVGDYIQLAGVDTLAGFYQVSSTDDMTIIVDTVTTKSFTEFSTLTVNILTSQRSATLSDANLPANTLDGELFWTGDEILRNWKVWQFNPVYSKVQLNNADQRSAYSYGTLLTVNADATLMAVDNHSSEVIIREKIGIATPWSLRQTIQVPFFAKLVIGNDWNTLDDKAPTAIAFSADGTWLAVGAANVSHITTGASNGSYTPVSVTGTDSGLTSQGVISLYKKDANNIFTLVDSIVSPEPANDELFGSALAFVGNKLLITAPGSNTVYTMVYGESEPVVVSYNSVGSTGATITVSSTVGITAGMRVRGTGFDSDQHVLEVLSSTKLLLSGSPSATPSIQLGFVTISWSYGVQTLSESSTNYGYKFSVSNDQTTLMVLSDDTIFPYRDIDGTLTAYGTPFTATAAAVSNNSGYLAISDSVDVKVYKDTGTEYALYKTLLPKHVGNFGSTLGFMNDFQSLVIYNLSMSGDTASIDVYDFYDTTWTYSETISSTTVGTDYGFAIGENQVLFTGDPSKIFVAGKAPGAFTWTVVHTQQPIPDVSKIKKVFLYDKSLGKLVKYLDVIDPAQGKIPGLADEELKFKTFYDPATYSNVSTVTDTINVNENTFWSKAQVGMLWWDLRQAKFINSYFDDIVYRNSVWNTLSNGASIDVYEWVESKFKPSVWDAQADTPAGVALGISGTSLYGDSAYSVRERYDNISKTFPKTYYFWVKNKNIVPNVPGRKMSALNVASLISNPRGQGYSYLALTGVDSFSVVNVKQYLNDANVVMSIEYWLTDKTDQNIHSQWKLISNDPIVAIPESIEQKWFDSLTGVDATGRSVPDLTQPFKLRYGIENRPRQSMFVNRIEALKEFVERVNRIMLDKQIVENYDISPLDTYDAQPSIITGLYDTVLDTDAELRFANTSAYIRPILSPVVSDDGAIIGVDVVYAGRGFVNAPPIQIVGNGVGAVVKAITNASGQIVGATVLDGGQGYYQDTTSAKVRDFSVLIQSDSQASGNWSIYSYDTTNAVWSRSLTQSYDVRKYWSYKPWFDYSAGFNQFSAPDYAVNTFVELSSISVSIGEIVKVLTANTGGWLLLQKYADSESVDWTQSYKLVGMENGTIQLSAALYDFSGTAIGYDAGTYDGEVYDLLAVQELRIILGTLKNNIFIGELKQPYMDLFLASVRYAHSEQVYLDWAFKTSFVRATHHVGPLNQPVTYPIDNIANFEEYISEVKPYRTHIREYISNYDKMEVVQQAVTDFDVQPIYSNGSISVINAKFTGDTIEVLEPIVQSYPWKYWLDNVGFKITSLALIDGGSGYTGQPTVEIVSSSGSDARAAAYVSNGKVNRIVLMSAGSGYLSAPEVRITGGGGTGARAVAIIGDSVVRSNLISLKFDRVTQSYYITDLAVVESKDTNPILVGTGSRLQFPLVWGPDVNIGKASVTVGGIPVLRDTYKLRIVKSTVLGYTKYSGSIVFETAPAKGKDIVVNYMKDVSLLNAADRIQYYYNSSTNELGKDLSQLMTGIDYGGVQVSGLGFELASGWDKRPYGSEGWDVYDQSFNDYIVEVSAGTHSFTLPYSTTKEINVYHYVKSIKSVVSDGVQLNYTYSPDAKYPSANMTTLINSSGTNVEGVNTLTLADASSVAVGDVVTFDQTVNGTVVATSNTLNITKTALETVALDGSIRLNSVAGLLLDDPVTLTGVEFGNLSVGTIYYIIGIDGLNVKLSTTLQGSPIVVSDATGSMLFSVARVVNTLTLSSTSGLVTGDKIKISGTTFGGLAERVYYITSVSGNNITVTTRLGGSRVQVSNGSGSMAFEKVNPFGYNAKVIDVTNNTVTLNQIVFVRILDNTVITFTRELVQPTNISIYPNGTAVLTAPIPEGSSLNIVGMIDPVRIDQDLITHVGQVYTIPDSIVVRTGDRFILREITSDGSIKPQEADYDTAITGGDLAYSTATGLNPEDIVIDGSGQHLANGEMVTDGFVTTTSSPAPEEVVPGQIVDAVAIKVFDNPNAGSAKIDVKNHIADGVTSAFAIGQRPNSKEAVIVKVGNAVLNYNVDYAVNFNANTVELVDPPAANSTVTIFSIGISGVNILDLNSFVADGTTTEFLTHATWITNNVTEDLFANSLIYVDGIPTSPELFKTDVTYDLPGVVGIRFATAPDAGQLITYVIVAGNTRTFGITNTTTFTADGNTVYPLTVQIGNALPNESNMIVRVDQTIIQAPNNSYFTIGSNRLTYVIDPNKYPPNTVNNNNIVVFANGVRLSYGVDYTVDLGGLSIKINRSAYNKYTGKQLIVSITTDRGYVYDPFLREITFAQPQTGTVEIVSSYIHDILDIQRTTINVTSTLALTPDTTEFYYFKSIAGGKILLDRPVVSDKYVWVSVNGRLLTPSVDYKLLDDHATIQLAVTPAANDAVEIMTFGRNVLPSSGIAYMQFKDMLNRVHFKRLNANKQTRLAKDLHFSDLTIVLEDASNFEEPSIAQNRPGIIEVRGERIEYFKIDGNVLSKLRRGTLGTGTPMHHRVGTYVQDIGSNETIPYSETTTTEQVLSNGSNVINISFTPKLYPVVDPTTAETRYLPADVEVFVGGYNDSAIWTPGVDYTAGQIVRIGSYTYKCTLTHTSSTTFTLDSDNWTFFVGNIRLKKDAYQVFNVNKAPYSPAGDVDFAADFTVDGTSAQLVLATPLSVGTQVTVVKRTGTAWDSTINIQEEDNKIARFLKEQPGTWYTDVKPRSTTMENATFDNNIDKVWNSKTITFDQGN